MKVIKKFNIEVDKLVKSDKSGRVVTKTNKVSCIETNDLYEIYDFVHNDYEQCLIHKEDVYNVIILNFHAVPNDIIDKILEIAEEHRTDVHHLNFSVYSDGTIILGSHMLDIKNRLKTMRNLYEHYKTEANSVKIIL